MNKDFPKKDKTNKDLVNLSKKSSCLCKTDLDSIGINLSVKHTIHQVGGHKYSVNSVCFSPDGKLFATRSSDNRSWIMDVATGRCIQVLEGHTSTICSICFSWNSKQLATGSLDHIVRFWDIISGTHLVTFHNLDHGFL